MTHSTLAPRRHATGFTLIEMLAVIMIVCLLAGLTISLVRYAMSKAEESAVKTEIATIEDACNRYRDQTGVFPPTGMSGLLVLTNGYLVWPARRVITVSPGPGLESAYGTIYRYNRPGTFNTQTFDLFATSQDGNRTNSNYSR